MLSAAVWVADAGRVALSKGVGALEESASDDTAALGTVADAAGSATDEAGLGGNGSTMDGGASVLSLFFS